MRTIYYSPTAVVEVPNIFGDGSDGAATLSANKTLTRDWNYTNLTINAGVTVFTNGYRLMVNGVLTNNGTIKNNGSDATAANVIPPGAPSGSMPGGGDGAPADDFAHFGDYPAPDQDLGPSSGSVGGGGGAFTLGKGGSFSSTENISQLKNAVAPFKLDFLVGANVKPMSPSTGGGSGHIIGGPTAGWSGGGGGGGGWVFISAKTLANNGSIQANGGNATASSLNGTGGTGGGGGGGGIVVIIGIFITQGTITATGGSAGAGSGGGASGTAGTDGSVIIVPGV